MAGPYKEGLQDLLRLLGAGLPFDSGYQMYSGLQDEREQRQSARQDAILAAQQAYQTQQQGLLGDMGSSAISAAQNNVPLDALQGQLAAQMQFSGGQLAPQYGQQLLGGLSNLYDPSGNSLLASTEDLFDSDDEEAVFNNAAQLLQQGIPRAAARQQIGSAIKQSLGEANYLRMRHLMDAAINQAYAGQPM